MLKRTLMILAVACTLSASNARAQFLQPDFVFTFAAPNTRVDVLQYATKGIVGPDRVETVANIISGVNALQVRFSTTATAGIPTAHGAALAAILGFMQGRSADDIVKIVGPDIPLSIVAANLQSSGGPPESGHVQAVAEQLASAVAHIEMNAVTGKQELMAFQSASADLGVNVGCK